MKPSITNSYDSGQNPPENRAANRQVGASQSAVGARKMIPTDAAAKALNVLPNTLRSALCKTGNYMGLKPIKLPNRRLIWDADAITSLLNGEVK